MSFLQSFRFAFLTVLLVSTLGCSLPFNLGDSSKTSYRLVLQSVPRSENIAVNRRLGIRDILSSGFIDSHRVVFSRSAGQLGYYQYAAWVELPAKQLTDIFFLALQQSNLFQAVTRTTSGALYDWQLNAELLEFTHDLTENKATIVLQAEVIDLKSRGVLGAKTFSVSARVGRNDADGAVEGFNEASSEVMQLLVKWITSIPH